MADVPPWGGGGVGCVQLEESEFTCAAAVKARKAMEVEIEDLHLQIDDIAKAKTAVRPRGVQSRTRAAEGQRSHDSGSFYAKQGSFPSPGLSAGRVGLHSSASPPLRGLGGGGETEEEASEGPSPCLTTCLWELGHRPQHHK